jgi:hypothetical protein
MAMEKTGSCTTPSINNTVPTKSELREITFRHSKHKTYTGFM